MYTLPGHSTRQHEEASIDIKDSLTKAACSPPGIDCLGIVAFWLYQTNHALFHLSAAQH